jgi:cytochrome c biogenesis protein CcmG, thiol:disulfide interchange protein DsbE
MNKLLVTLLLALLSQICLGKAKVGEPFPEITGELTNNTRFSTQSYQGKVLLINFWASWCEPCREEMPLIDAFYKKYKKDGFEVIAISLDSEKDIPQARLILKNYSFSSALKNQVDYSKLGRIWRIPSTFIIDRQGILIKDGLTGDPKVDEETLNHIVLPAILNK